MIYKQFSAKQIINMIIAWMENLITDNHFVWAMRKAYKNRIWIKTVLVLGPPDDLE